MPRLGQLDREEDVCILTRCLILFTATSSLQAMLKNPRAYPYFLLSVKQPELTVLGQGVTVFWDSPSGALDF